MYAQELYLSISFPESSLPLLNEGSGNEIDVITDNAYHSTDEA